MPQGLAIPLRVSATGRTMLASGDSQADKIIRLSLGDNDSENAFQLNINFGTSEVFALRNPGFRARTLARIFEIFDDFERRKLYQLDRDSIAWGAEGGGDATLTFRYRNLESDESITFREDFAAKV